ncbi:MAG: nucleotide sugar dehydrogenase [Clostridia bacterium]|nr:nucleotide sugar dehydrogenase [Clostridia bacterium]
MNEENVNKKNNVGIIGLGYIGTPLAYLTASKGYNVIGIDTNENAIKKINNRLDIPKQIKDSCKEIKLTATSNYSMLQECDIIIICIPTPTKNDIPDLTIMKNVMCNMDRYIKKQSLIIIESTVAPGMTRKYVEKYLKEKRMLKINTDYQLAYCPERIDPGNSKFWVGNINRVCGASSKEALNRTCEFYNSIIDAKISPFNSIEEAELIKVWENSMRNLNIAQANLLAMICDRYGFEVDKITQGLETKIEQFGNKLAYPGIGPGGHCIPEDIHYLIKNIETNVNMRLLEEAVNINEKMPQYIYKKLEERTLNKNDNMQSLNILMLGKSYKANSKDIRRSQAIELYNVIKIHTNNVNIYDPIVDVDNINSINTNNMLDRYLINADVIIISCPHDIFLNIDYIKYKNIKYIVDCWNKLDKEVIISSGIEYIGVGK